MEDKKYSLTIIPWREANDTHKLNLEFIFHNDGSWSLNSILLRLIFESGSEEETTVVRPGGPAF